jgi:hypothetical protein
MNSTTQFGLWYSRHDSITRALWIATVAIIALFALFSLIGSIISGVSEAHLESWIWGMIAIVAVIGLYLGPALIALIRFHQNSASIFVVNFVLGWTFLGWVAALVWAVMPVNNPSASTIGLNAVGRELGQ